MPHDSDGYCFLAECPCVRPSIVYTSVCISFPCDNVYAFSQIPLKILYVHLYKKELDRIVNGRFSIHIYGVIASD